MEILILPKYNADGPSSRYRSYNYQSYFKDNNIKYTFMPLLTDDYIKELYLGNRTKVKIIQIISVLKRFIYLLLLKKKYDLIIIEKELFPNMPFFIERLLLFNQKYSLDFDDYIAASYKNNKIKAFFLGNKIDKLSQNAKFVTVGNKWYFEEIKSNNMVYLPTVVDINRYSPLNIKEKEKEIVIVWIGSPGNAKYLYLIKDVLIELSKKYNFILKVIGAKIKIEGVKIREVKWSKSSEISELYSSDIGIMPLENSLWEKGKCGFKLIQYMGCSLPVVASDSPANNEIINDKKNGFITKDMNDWYNYLEFLIIKKDEREKMGEKGRDIVERKYSYQNWGRYYSQLIINA